MHAYFFCDFLHFDMSLLLLTVTLRGVSNKHCLLPLFSFYKWWYFRSVKRTLLQVAVSANKLSKHLMPLHCYGKNGNNVPHFLDFLHLKITIRISYKYRVFHNICPYNKL